MTKTYKDFIQEAVTSEAKGKEDFTLVSEGVVTPEDVMAAIETAFKKSFPNGWIRIKIRNMLGLDAISFDLGLIGDKSEWGSGI